MRIYNTLTKQKETFSPIDPNVVKMFVCGPTVYGLSHIGHAKTYTQFDFVARYLKMKGYKVTYIQNITDVDDKIIQRAKTLDIEARALATQYEEEYKQDMAALHNTNVDLLAPAHDYIDAMVHQVEQLIERGYAYRVEDGWYFDTSKFKGYGKLSGRKDVEPEDSVARIDDHHQKRNPGDFALWKMRKPGEPHWPTSIGDGRPGWHIEDTAITEKIFGPQYDLHGGAVDLIFPHHENEIAQMEGASGLVPMVRYWMHTGLVRTEGAKMSKSADNFTTIRDALKKTDFRTLRFIFLSQHYRSSIEISDEVINSAKGARRRIEHFFRSINPSRSEPKDEMDLVKKTEQRFFDRLDDDLDTPGALAVLFEFIREQNRTGNPGKSTLEFIQKVQQLFDAFDMVSLASDESNEIEQLLEERKALRQAKKFEEADNIRDKLLQRGIQIKDTEQGVQWWREETKLS